MQITPEVAVLASVEVFKTPTASMIESRNPILFRGRPAIKLILPRLGKTLDVSE